MFADAGIPHRRFRRLLMSCAPLGDDETAALGERGQRDSADAEQHRAIRPGLRPQRRFRLTSARGLSDAVGGEAATLFVFEPSVGTRESDAAARRWNESACSAVSRAAPPVRVAAPAAQPPRRQERSFAFERPRRTRAGRWAVKVVGEGAGDGDESGWSHDPLRATRPMSRGPRCWRNF